MNQILEQLGTYGIVPVVVLQDAAKAEPLAKALCKGGLACAEVTFRTDAAEESIRIMSEKFPCIITGQVVFFYCANCRIHCKTCCFVICWELLLWFKNIIFLQGCFYYERKTADEICHPAVHDFGYV